MARRSTSQFKIDDLAYPIRVKFIVPSGGLQQLDISPQTWLEENLEHLAWAWGPAQTIGGQATAYYFRTLEDAQRFIAAFPQLEMADAIAAGLYSSPSKSAGTRPRDHCAHTLAAGWSGD